MPSLKDKTVLIIGRGSGIARAIALAVIEDAGRVIVAGRHPDDLRGKPRIRRVVGTVDDIAAAALAVLTNGFLTGASIPVDGGEHLI
jgi:NAD(P)-dependent dehydrogenase (short-subunit alcohol dehydrogenase family)